MSSDVAKCPMGVLKSSLDICELGKSSSSDVIEMEAGQQWAAEEDGGEGSLLVTQQIALQNCFAEK